MKAREPHERICGAKKRDGTLCRKPPMANGRCRLHGGATPGGIACANYKHGRYSRFVPRGLKRGYEAALADTELASLREELALQQAMMCELLKQMEKSPAPPWAQAYQLYQVAWAAKDVRVKAAKLTELGALLRAGAAAGAGHERARRERRELIPETTRGAAGAAVIYPIQDDDGRRGGPTAGGHGADADPGAGHDVGEHRNRRGEG
jgi:hypothetical protein